MGQRYVYPADRFDTVPVGGRRGARLGAHRANPRQRFLGRWVLLVLSCTLVLTLLGVLWLMRVGADSTVFSSAKDAVKSGETVTPTPAPVEAETAQAPEPAPEPEPAQPVINPDATVTVLNGTVTAGLAGRVAQEITDSGWGNVIAVGNTPDYAETAISAIYYADEAQATAAQALAVQLGIAAHFDPAYANYGSDLVVVIGADRAE